jgi:hypothetical protein
VRSLAPAALLGIVAFAAADVHGVEDARDERRSAWRYRREVAIEPRPGAPFAALVLPPELMARCEPDLRDLRLVDGNGGEIPYAADRRVERRQAARWAGTLVDQRSERKRRSQWTVDLGAVRTFDTVTLDVRDTDFAKRVRLEAGAGSGEWSVLLEDAGIFDREWGGRLHHTTLALREPVAARYLRVTADDRSSRPVAVAGLTASAERSTPEQEWRLPVPLRRVASEPGRSRYRLEAPSGLPIEALRFAAGEAAFARRVLVREARERNGRREETLLGDGRVFRVRLEDAALSAESVRIGLAAPSGGELTLEIEDGDSPPLRGLALEAIGTRVRLLFPAPSEPIVLYYGNDVTRAPLYDLASLSDRLAWLDAPARASVGAEAANPRFRRPVPIPMAPARGASVDARRWRYARPLVLTTPAEDIVSLLLGAGDVAVLRDDFADLRIVDAQGRQVPFVLERGVATERVGLDVAREAPRAARDARPVSRYRIRTATPVDGRALPLPAVSLELPLAEPFFDRPGRLLAAAAGRAGEQVLHAGRLARRAAGSPNAPAPPLAIPLDGRRREAVTLEIEDGDNAPLTLASATGVVRVARAAFKAGPGSYRVLLGNRDARPPQYDLASLREDVLAYSALPVSAGPLGASAGRRREVGDYLGEAPPTLLLWGSLAAAVAGLLYLTARIVRQPSA